MSVITRRSFIALMFSLCLHTIVFAQETSPPVLSELVLTNASVNTSAGTQTVTLHLSFEDENSVSLVSDLYLENMSDGSAVLFSQNSDWLSVNDVHSTSFSAQISSSESAGIWFVTGIIPVDSEGNSNNIYDTMQELVAAQVNPFVSHAKLSNDVAFDASVTASATFSQTGNSQTSLLNVTLKDTEQYTIWFVPDTGTEIVNVNFSNGTSIAQSCETDTAFTKCLVTSSNNNAAILATLDTSSDGSTDFGYSTLVQASASNLEGDWINNLAYFPPEDYDGDGIANEQDIDADNDGVDNTNDAFPLDETESADFDNDGSGDNADTDDDNDGVPDTQDSFPFDSSENGDNDNDGLGNNSDTDDDNDGVIDSNDAFPFDSSESVDTDADGIGNNADEDDDNDGGQDVSDAFPLDPTETIDSDGDGIGNNADTDDDNDGTPDESDAFPRDPTEDTDTDEDGIGNNTDDDDDNDTILDVDDAFPLDSGDYNDNDNDGIGDSADTDDDNDNIPDTEDAFPFNASEYLDTDGDGIGNNADFDDDNDGLDDSFDAFPLDASEIGDYDGDLIGDNADTDDDNDGVIDTEDAFPFAVGEWFDTDGDGIGNNADFDDDNDGVDDEFDAFDNDPTEISDFDEDGVGDNADLDDDNDGVEDLVDAFPFDANETLDTDGDGIGDNTDTDDDGDSIEDSEDLFPLDRNEHADNDLDGIGNNTDIDDDNDGVIDINDAFPFDASETEDLDNDGVGNNADDDDDNDGFVDADDVFPLDASEWADNDLDGIGNNLDSDDDNDGIVDSEDVFPFDATETLDNDQDGIGNNADTDDDNDGVLDDVDAFPFSDAESIDSDGDGIGNNADVDDDNDGIVDEDDAQPLNATIGDFTAPVLDNIADFTIEATATLTPYELTEPRVSDGNLNAATLSSDYSGYLSLGENVVTWTATDFAGNQSELTQTVTVVDTTAPEFPQIDTIEIDARGYLTDVSYDISVSANDLVDGDINASIITTSQLRAGAQSVILSATDNSGNTSMLEVFVDIAPLLVVDTNLVASPGSSLSLEFTLSDIAPQYPVSFEYTLAGPVTNILSGVLEIDEGQTGVLTLDVAQTASLGDLVSVNLANPVNASLGDASDITIEIDTTNYAPIASIVAKQNAAVTSVVYQDQGVASLIAQISDVNADDSHEVSWSFAEGSLTNLSTVSTELEFDPSSLSTGTYIAQAVISESNTFVAYSITIEFPLVIAAQAPSLSSSVDSDFDGMSDAIEGYSDSDQDGIPNYLDDNANPYILATGVSEQPLTTSIGYELTVGDIARIADGASASSSVVSMADIANYGSETGEQTSLADDVHFEAIQSIHTFNIENLDYAGQSVAVVIPLDTGSTIPNDAVYRKYNSSYGWFTFVENSENAIYSAPFDSDGNCPSIDSSLYLSGLNEGDSCIQLLIQDGGPNDADLEANGIIKDPGVLASELANTAPLISVNRQTTVTEGEEVRIDASLTTDVQDDELTYYWTQIGGYPIALSETTTPLLTFVAPEVNNSENLLFKLEVYDGRDTSTINVSVSVRDSNNAPQVSFVAHSSTVEEASNINLSVQASDNDNDSLQIQWTQISGPQVSLSGATSSQISFTAPSVESDQTIEFQVRVSDGTKEVAITTELTVLNSDSSSTTSDSESGDSGGGSMSSVALMFMLFVAVLRRIKFIKREALG
ncbi:thrombospondin type 3 repeat-containing protein [Glaciecola sp. 2405UD65-10]|uniref:thrombospondin type 3 repeat-containing protein n=1 Tax=Glaciecola sp. 2405UD65-10 TaxID=3397244 RepID=UPI003B598E83